MKSQLVQIRIKNLETDSYKSSFFVLSKTDLDKQLHNTMYKLRIVISEPNSFELFTNKIKLLKENIWTPIEISSSMYTNYKCQKFKLDLNFYASIEFKNDLINRIKHDECIIIDSESKNPISVTSLINNHINIIDSIEKWLKKQGYNLDSINI